MERLSLDAFKVEAETKKEEKTNELENLSGGILGACHCSHCGGDDGDGGYWDLWVHTVFECEQTRFINNTHVKW